MPDWESVDAVCGRLREGCSVVLDTNAVYMSGLIKIADSVNQLNAAQPEKRTTLLIPTLVAAEHFAQERRRWKTDYDLGRVMEVLKSKGFDAGDGFHKFLPFDYKHAEQFGESLASRYSTQEKWSSAKHASCQRCLAGAAATSPTAGSSSPTAGSRRCSATVDWFIGQQATALSALLITDDKGEEYDDISRATRKTFMEALGQLVPTPQRNATQRKGGTNLTSK